ncbi:ATP-binding protein [Bacteroidota bacterium]
MEKLTLDSNLKNITAVESFVEEISDRYHLNETHFGPMLIALTEAFKNAVIHGNKNNSQKKVFIALDPVKNGLSFSISDEGNGFNFESLPDPLSAEDNEIDKTGRGLFLIKSLTSDLSFADNGKTIEMIFNIDGIGQRIMNERHKAFNKYFQKDKHKV